MTKNLSRRKFLAYGSAAFGTSLLLKACGGAPTTGVSPTAPDSPAASPASGKVKDEGRLYSPFRAAVGQRTEDLPADSATLAIPPLTLPSFSGHGGQATQKL